MFSTSGMLYRTIDCISLQNVCALFAKHLMQWPTKRAYCRPTHCKLWSHVVQLERF